MICPRVSQPPRSQTPIRTRWNSLVDPEVRSRVRSWRISRRAALESLGRGPTYRAVAPPRDGAVMPNIIRQAIPLPGTAKSGTGQPPNSTGLSRPPAPDFGFPPDNFTRSSTRRKPRPRDEGARRGPPWHRSSCAWSRTLPGRGFRRGAWLLHTAAVALRSQSHSHSAIRTVASTPPSRAKSMTSALGRRANPDACFRKQA